MVAEASAFLLRSDTEQSKRGPSNPGGMGDWIHVLFLIEL